MRPSLAPKSGTAKQRCAGSVEFEGTSTTTLLSKRAALVTKGARDHTQGLPRMLAHLAERIEALGPRCCRIVAVEA
jgi:hypothetical protein